MAMNYSFVDLVDIPQVQRLVKNLYSVTGMPITLLGVDGTFLLEMGWSNLCIQYHFKHPDASKCHQDLLEQVSNPKNLDQFLYQCGNGLRHALIPIVLDGQHCASVFLGQFFLEEEQIDFERFRQQAKEYGIDEKTYMEAIRQVPVYSYNRVKNIMGFVQEMVHTLAEMGLTHLKERQSEKELLAIKLKYQEMMDLLPIPVFETDARGCLTFANRQSFQTFGFTPEDFKRGINVLDTLAPEDRARAFKNMGEVSQGKTSGNEYTALRKDGSTFWVIIYSSPIWQEDQFAGFRGVVIDVTPLKENEDKYRTLVETTQTGFVIVDEDGIVLDANTEYVRLTGHTSLEEIAGRTVLEWTAPHDLERNALEVTKCFKNGFVRNLEIDYSCDQQNFIPVEINATVLNTSHGTRILTLCRDISKRKEIERSLKDSQERLMEAQKVSHTGSWDLDLDKKTMWASEEAFHIYGFDLTAERLLPLNRVQAMVEAQFRPILDQALIDLITYGEKKPYNVEFYINRPSDGQRRAVHSVATLVRDENGRPARVSGTIQDISERKMVEEEIRCLNLELEERVHLRTLQLEAANKELEAFAYSVSHDLRAPLRALNGFSHLLSEEYEAVLGENGREYLKHIRDASIHMSNLIDDILKLSRISRTEMTLTQVNLSEMAQDILADLQNNQPGRRVKVQISPGLTARADESLMRIALTNLLGNAWKFSAKKTDAQIQFGAREVDNHSEFFIRDNGAGFDMAYAEKLFNPFQRLHSDKDFEGTGIGLAIVQRIIQRHGGSVWAEAKIDQGAVFYFILG